MSDTGDAAIRMRGLVKIFRDFWHRPRVTAVNGVDLDVRSGEIFGLLGPNGSGKSTSIKMMLGLLHPTAGHIEVLGASPRHVPTKRRIGYLPEESYLYTYLTPRETLGFYGRLFDLPRPLLRQRTDELIATVGLRDAADRPVREFSKGMARRLGLAQALINDPDLLILDEPTAGLDPIGCRQMKDLLLDLARRGKTILLSSHLLADVEDVCDRIAILYNGRLRALGQVQALLEKQDRLQITLPVLAPDRLRALLDALRSATAEEPEVRHPSINLEQFFLRVVAEAGQAETGIPAAGGNACRDA